MVLEEKKRDFSLDLLRFIGVLIIMVAHSEPPSWLYQLRNFGTPLLIVASALTYSVIYRSKKMETGSFYKRRFSRLIIPAWMFLTVFFTLFFIAFRIVDRPYPFNTKMIIASYCFSGIGYIWILKVYIILAVITPFALKLESRVKSSANYFSLLFLLYAAYEILYAYSVQYIPAVYKPILVSNVYVVLPYSILFLFGLRLGKLDRSSILTASCCAFAVFLIFAGQKYWDTGEFVQTQEFKYPPTLYYLAYAFFCVNILYLSKDALTRMVNKEIITWLSSNSLWIYLWHILAVSTWEFTLGSTHGVFLTSSLKAVYLFTFGVLVTYLQVAYAKKMLLKSEKPILRWFGRMLSPA